MTDIELTRRVRPDFARLSFDDQVKATGEVAKTLGALKHEHRVWPVGGKFVITSKGRRHHG